MNILNILLEQLKKNTPVVKQDQAGTSVDSNVVDPNASRVPTQIRPPDPVAAQAASKGNELVPPEEEFRDPQELAGLDTGGPELLVSADPLENINKMYRLKKIFIKIKSIQDMLDGFSEPEFDDLKTSMVDANDMLVNILIPNLPTYAEKIDDIIDYYEKFLLNISTEMERIYDTVRSDTDVHNNGTGRSKYSEKYKADKRQDKNGVHSTNMRRHK